MKLVFERCGNIDRAELGVAPGKLNIKYGANGVGKSTMARALILSKSGQGLEDLVPFKARGFGAGGHPAPVVTGHESISQVMAFNEQYVDQFLFTPDDLVQDSFEIFVRSEEYDARLEAIELRLKALKKAMQDHPGIDQAILDLAGLSDSFGKSKTGYAKSGKLAKAFGSGNKVEHVPSHLSAYAPFIQSESNIKWIGWQIKGKPFLEIAEDACPYCTEPVAAKKDVVLAVESEYDAKSIEHLVELQAIMDRLGQYFSATTRASLAAIVKNKAALSEEEINYLKEVRNQVDALREKLTSLRTLSFPALRDAPSVTSALEPLRINLALLSHLQSTPTVALVEELNAKIDEILTDAGVLQGEVKMHHNAIGKTIKTHADEINGFLRRAGYRYSVEVVRTEETYKMRLRHDDWEAHIEGGSNHLSYGERNAFSLVLFMYECLRKRPDLVLLDDPISSFDRNKKFAVMDMLFRSSGSLRGFTTIMFTHDLEPLLDTVKTMRGIFDPVPTAHFLTARAGQVHERQVLPSDLQSFAQICKENIADGCPAVVRTIYLRRHFEILDEKGSAYHLLSSALHGRPDPTIHDTAGNRNMTPAERAAAEASVREHIADFSYASVVASVSDKATLKATYAAQPAGYERLQLCRLIVPPTELAGLDPVIRKFVTETFHVENELVYQLNPRRFDQVPEYIVAECDRLVAASA